MKRCKRQPLYFLRHMLYEHGWRFVAALRGVACGVACGVAYASRSFAAPLRRCYNDHDGEHDDKQVRRSAAQHESMR
jgi:hypothetical protein